MEQMRWVIVGTGYIANEFAKGMGEVKDARLSAVVSRNEDSGKAFARKYGCDRVYTDFTKMLAEEKPEVVYLAVPNDCHYRYIMEALERGIPVLCEKPIVDNGEQLEQILKKAKEKQTFLMEGMWTRCFPAVQRAQSWIKEGRIGRPLTVRSSFDIKPDPADWQPWKGGIRHAAGALRDVGIYALAMAHMVFPEKPQEIYSAMKSNGEVDESFRMLVDYGEGRTAVLGGAFNQIGTPETEITGDAGRIVIGPEFWHPFTATLMQNDGIVETFTAPYPATGFQFEIQEVQRCIREGRKESGRFTLEETRQIADIIENTRKNWGIFYEADKRGEA